MRITKCVKGHYYDLDRYKDCPVCKEHSFSEDERNRIDNLRDSKTIAISRLGMSERLHTEALTEGYFSGRPSDGKTIGFAIGKNKINPIAGWLVCEKGKDRGRFYAIYEGKNFVGKSKTMDIVLDDKNICEKNECCFIYDARHTEFYALKCDGSVVVNGISVSNNVRIADNDKIDIGNESLRFIQYCNAERNWNEEDN